MQTKMLILTMILVVLLLVSGCGTRLKNPVPDESPRQSVDQPSVSETPPVESDAHTDQTESVPVGKSGMVIVSDNPVLTDSKTLLEELDQEIGQLLESLESMDSVDDEELNF